MVTPSAGAVVLVRFPFSDLSSSKLRPSVVLASSGKDDWILCQVTSNPYTDVKAVVLTDDDFSDGSLRRPSFARPGKLFTANIDLMTHIAGRLHWLAFERISNSIVAMIHDAQNEVQSTS